MRWRRTDCGEKANKTRGKARRKNEEGKPKGAAQTRDALCLYPATKAGFAASSPAVAIYMPKPHTVLVNSDNGKNRNEGLLRLKDLIEIYSKVLAEGHETIIGRDLNVDRLKSNNPEERYDIKTIIPV